MQRFVRMVPAPVFAGFNTALALTILISQTALLWNSRAADGAWFIAIALLVTAVAITSRRFTPLMPHGVVGLIVGMLAVLVLGGAGLHILRNVMDGGITLSLPVFHVPWRDSWASGVDSSAIVRDVLLASLTLSVLAFLNTVVSSEAVTQLDGSEPRLRD